VQKLVPRCCAFSANKRSKVQNVANTVQISDSSSKMLQIISAQMRDFSSKMQQITNRNTPDQLQIETNNIFSRYFDIYISTYAHLILLHIFLLRNLYMTYFETQCHRNGHGEWRTMCNYLIFRLSSSCAAKVFNANACGAHSRFCSVSVCHSSGWLLAVCKSGTWFPFPEI